MQVGNIEKGLHGSISFFIRVRTASKRSTATEKKKKRTKSKAITPKFITHLMIKTLRHNARPNSKKPTAKKRPREVSTTHLILHNPKTQLSPCLIYNACERVAIQQRLVTMSLKMATDDLRHYENPNHGITNQTTWIIPGTYGLRTSTHTLTSVNNTMVSTLAWVGSRHSRRGRFQRFKVPFWGFQPPGA